MSVQKVIVGAQTSLNDLARYTEASWSATSNSSEVGMGELRECMVLSCEARRSFSAKHSNISCTR